MLALGPQAVRQQSQVDVGVPAALGSRQQVLELILEDRLGVMQQAPDQRRLAIVHRAGGGEPQQLGGPGTGEMAVRRCACGHGYHLEVPLALAVLHGSLRDPVIGTRLAPLGDPGGRDLRDHVFERRGGRAHGARAGHITDRPVPD